MEYWHEIKDIILATLLTRIFGFFEVTMNFASKKFQKLIWN